LSLLIFSHANGFPASTYNVIFRSLRARGFTVRAVEKFGHDAAYPVTNNWLHLVQQLADFAAEQVAQFGKPAFLVGHSLGGYLSAMTAARHPELARGVLLLDSPLLHGWRATTLRLAKKTSLGESLSPGAVSKKRRQHWPDADAVLAHFSAKPAFARWEAQVLQDYVSHGTQDVDGQRVLSFDRAVETQIYNTLPDNLQNLLRRKPLQCPAAFIGGQTSKEVKQVTMGLTEKITEGRVHWLPGGHLFPMEKPHETAELVAKQLRAWS
jgi:pimeloyl-ACP methyl ester carboxylesterase